MHLSRLLPVPMLLIATTAPECASGQELSSIVPAGTRVRIWSQDLGIKKTRATLLNWGVSSVHFQRVADTPDSVLIPFSGLNKLEMFAGKNTWKGIGMGLFIGASIGGLIGGVIGNDAVKGCGQFLCELEALNYMAGGMAIGGLLGGAAGAASPPDKWRRVELPEEAGFPPYRPPFHQTAAFRIGSSALLLFLAVALGS